MWRSHNASDERVCARVVEMRAKMRVNMISCPLTVERWRHQSCFLDHFCKLPRAECGNGLREAGIASVDFAQLACIDGELLRGRKELRLRRCEQHWLGRIRQKNLRSGPTRGGSRRKRSGASPALLWTAPSVVLVGRAVLADRSSTWPNPKSSAESLSDERCKRLFIPCLLSRWPVALATGFCRGSTRLRSAI